MSRASTDGGGATFSDRINLSNTTDADSWRVEMAGEGEILLLLLLAGGRLIKQVT